MTMGLDGELTNAVRSEGAATQGGATRSAGLDGKSTNPASETAEATGEQKSMPHIGSRILLITNNEARYEGYLCHINATNSTVTLSHVRCFGTEGRESTLVLPPSFSTYDYVVFSGSEIKDLAFATAPGVPGSAAGPNSAPFVSNPSDVIRADPAVITAGPQTFSSPSFPSGEAASSMGVNVNAGPMPGFWNTSTSPIRGGARHMGLSQTGGYSSPHANQFNPGPTSIYSNNDMHYPDRNGYSGGMHRRGGMLGMTRGANFRGRTSMNRGGYGDFNPNMQRPPRESYPNQGNFQNYNQNYMYGGRMNGSNYHTNSQNRMHTNNLALTMDSEEQLRPDFDFALANAKFSKPVDAMDAGRFIYVGDYTSGSFFDAISCEAVERRPTNNGNSVPKFFPSSPFPSSLSGNPLTAP